MSGTQAMHRFSAFTCSAKHKHGNPFITPSKRQNMANRSAVGFKLKPQRWLLRKKDFGRCGGEGKRTGKFTINRNHCDMIYMLLGPKLLKSQVFSSDRRWGWGGFTINRNNCDVTYVFLGSHLLAQVFPTDDVGEWKVGGVAEIYNQEN